MGNTASTVGYYTGLSRQNTTEPLEVTVEQPQPEIVAEQPEPVSEPPSLEAVNEQVSGTASMDEETDSDEDSDSDEDVQPIKPKSIGYRHPLFTLIDRNATELEFITTLDSFCGTRQTGSTTNGDPVYEMVDQVELIAPVLQVFSYCASYGKKEVVSWILENFVPLQVSYDNNFCYHECRRWGQHEIAQLISMHESFEPTMKIIHDLLERECFVQFRKCVVNSQAPPNVFLYRFTFLHYLDNSNYEAICNLFNRLVQIDEGAEIEIPDEIRLHPKLMALQEQKKQEAVLETLSETVHLEPVDIELPEQFQDAIQKVLEQDQEPAKVYYIDEVHLETGQLIPNAPTSAADFHLL